MTPEETYDKAVDLTAKLYKFYGTDSEHLFGISPEKKSAVMSIVIATLNILDATEEDLEQ